MEGAATAGDVITMEQKECGVVSEKELVDTRICCPHSYQPLYNIITTVLVGSHVDYKCIT